jgi:subtilisin family serine protease
MSRIGRSWVVAVVVALLAVAVGIPGVAAVSPNLPSPKDAAEYGRQWNLRAIYAEEAWAKGKLGSPGVAVAILDTGIDTEHPDLIGRVDLERSTSFLSRSKDCPVGEPGAPSSDEEDRTADRLGLPRVTDFHGHGTGVSGLISSNAVVLAGVSQRTRLFGVKVHDRSRANCITVYLDAVRHAADEGADVIHMSFPLEFTRDLFPATFDDLLARVDATMEYAHHKGAVLVAAAGNATMGRPPQDLDATPNTFRFCKAIHVVCVSATGPATPADVSYPGWDASAAYTNFGSAIDVAGPGGTGIFNVPADQERLVWLDCSRVTLAPGAPGECAKDGGRLIWGSTGTSFGAAATSGFLSLLVDEIGKNRPDEVIAALRASSDDLGVAGHDPYYGDGRINVAKAFAVQAP